MRRPISEIFLRGAAACLLAAFAAGQSCSVDAVIEHDDSDGDGYTDVQEEEHNPPTDPFDDDDNPGDIQDSDGDGCSDYGEIVFGHCDGDPDTDDDPGSSDNPAPGDDPSPVAAITLTGSLTVGANLIVDSDTADPNSARVSNDMIGPESNAQTAANPCVVGGFLGTLLTKSDRWDMYRVHMAAGQTATLLLADPDGNDFDLFLYDPEGTEIDSSEGVGKAEQVSVSLNGTYFLGVYGYSVEWADDGGGLYSLLIGENPLTADAAATLAHDRLSRFDPFAPGEVLVRYGKSVLSARTQLQASLGLERLDGGNNGGVHRYRLSSAVGSSAKTSRAARAEQVAATIATIKTLRRRSDVQWAEPNYIRYAHAVPDDVFYPNQWHYPIIGLPQAWDITTGSSDVTVAVIDTGVVSTHPDLSGQLIDGYDFISDVGASLDGDGIDSDPEDPGDSTGERTHSSYHGTHVIGTVAARTSNGMGVAGVAWNVKVMPLRVLGLGGAGTDYDIGQAVRYAAGLPNDSGTVPTRPADIINMSLGGPGFAYSLAASVTEARQAGVIIVTSSGNENGDADNSFPGNIDGVVNVSAVDLSLERAPYSNSGSSVVVTAPGGNMETDRDGDGFADGVLSTLRKDDGTFVYAYYEGTSMAAPHVAGVIALMKSVYPDLSPLDVDRLLAGTHPGTSLRITEDLGTPGRDAVFGYGLIDALNAVRAAAQIAGVSPVSEPVLRVTPRDLYFEAEMFSDEVTVSNGGGGTLEVTEADTTNDWLTVEPSAGGAGTYGVSVDRTGLTDGLYVGQVRFISNGGELAVAVRMIVGSPEITGGDIGTVYVLLVDPDTFKTVAQDMTDADSGYAFALSDVPPGKYRLYAGTDLDNNAFIDNEAEAFGGYPVVSQPAMVNVTEDLIGLSFSVSYLVNIQAPSTMALPSETDEPGPSLRRLEP